MKIARIYAFGDSIMTGTYALNGGWCDQIKRQLHKVTTESTEGVKRQTYNLGIGGETSRGLLKRVRNELDARHNVSWPAVIIIGIGKNDSRCINGESAVPIDEFADNLRKIIAIAQEYTDKIIAVGIGPCAEESILFKDYEYSRERLRAYDSILASVAKQAGVSYVPIYQHLVEAGDQVFYRDKLHINDQGHDIISEAIAPVLSDLLTS